ncbi:uncharacterized protein NEPG_02634 [Nematocida parisii ERTm1]|uniref:uncharacterized protein n=1 Tax=Nematocida parisii (strain ERTm1 / ATCC PRA-289) TaxID=881290 RepID=UPI000264B77A|nr:uncharacterized protein NEPG_02634 [Nematocida parisii ERTm1]EIJ92505.1 hypothetical protein NEPG_02634 [Nematocida parisii ERTm1]|eukprot:XP_013060461.1 hypothetical protein NEPG_02634 [Nematocida parisii ERTm1]
MQRMKEDCVNPNALTILNNIWFMWLCRACANTEYNPMIVNLIYTHLDPIRVCNRYIAQNAILIKNMSREVLSALEKEKESLCIENSPVSKEKYDKLTSIFKPRLDTEMSGLSLSEMSSRKRNIHGNPV